MPESLEHASYSEADLWAHLINKAGDKKADIHTATNYIHHGRLSRSRGRKGDNPTKLKTDNTIDRIRELTAIRAKTNISRAALGQRK